jgi:hypothetical protein
MSLTARGDLEGAADSVELGAAAGLGAALGPLSLSLGAVSAPGEALGGVIGAQAGPATLGVMVGEERSSAALGMGLDWGLSRIDLRCAANTDDSLEVEGRLLPGVRIINARLRAGGRLRASTGPEGEWEVQGDAIATYTLSTFSMVVALENLEDVYDDGTSFTYGVLWSFSDDVRRPERPEQEGGQ